MDIDSLKGINNAIRVDELERRVRDARGPRGDFEGTVTAYWKKLDNNAAGIVEYNGKEYTTRPLGWTSIVPGTPVTLTSAGGIYYTSW